MANSSTYKFTVEKLTSPDANPDSRLREKYCGAVWEFRWPCSAFNEWVDGSYNALRKAIRLAPEETGFELLINSSDSTIKIAPYSQVHAKREDPAAAIKPRKILVNIINVLNGVDVQVRNVSPREIGSRYVLVKGERDLYQEIKDTQTEPKRRKSPC